MAEGRDIAIALQGLLIHVHRARNVDRKHQFDRYLREAAVLPLYDAGNFGMQRRRVHGVMADPSFNPRAVMDDEAIEFTKAMEGIDTIPGPKTDGQQSTSQADKSSFARQ